MQEPGLAQLTYDWQTTWETGVHSRTLQRYLSLGLVEMERRQKKRYWRLRHEARSKAA